MPSMRHALLFALSCSGLACTETPKPDPSVAPPSSAGSLAQPAPAPSAKVEEIDRSPIAVKESTERLKLSATAFDTELLHEQTRRSIKETTLRLHPLRDRILVSYAGCVAVLEDHRLQLGHDIFPAEAYEFTAIGGAWPQAVVAQVEFDSWKSDGFARQAPIHRTDYYRWAGDAWRMLMSDATTKVAAWRGESVLTLDKQALGIVSTEKKAPPESASKLAPPKQAAPRDATRCKDAAAEVVAEELDALPSGEAFVLGKHCGAGAYAMERWTADSTESAVVDLPDAPSTAKRGFISAASRDKVHVVISTGEKVYAARWDGKAFRSIELKEEGEVRAIWTATDGTLFFVLQPRKDNPKKTKAELVRVLTSGDVNRSATFALSPLVKVWAADAQTAYVSSFGSILSTKAGLVFTAAPEKEEPKVAEAPSPASAFPPFTDGCATPFVFLYDISAKSPPGYDFPGTRTALSTFARAADIELVEFIFTSQRRLGVKVPSADVGREVVAHVVAKMKGEHPALVCLAPTEGVRTIKLAEAP